MNRLFFSLSFSLLFLHACQAQPPQKEGKGLYEIKSGIIEKTITANQGGFDMMTRETIYFDDYGWKEARYREEHRTIPFINRKEVSSSISFVEGEDIINYDPKRGTATRMKVGLRSDIMSLSKSQQQQMGDEMTEAMNAETTSLGTGMVAGKLCNISETIMKDENGREIMRAKTWLYKGIVMKTEGKGMGVATEEVVSSLKENASIDPAKMNLPTGTKVQELPDFFGGN
ncbi:MAG: hypothetical protein AAF206_18150 [Bacteroidota bacterium]